jgi:hypothetical protein
MAKSLNDCRGELRDIIRELRSIESDVRSGSQGIGQDLCANCIGKVAAKYNDHVLTRLNNVDQNRLADWILGTKTEGSW